MDFQKSDRLVIVAGVGILLLGILRLVSDADPNPVAFWVGVGVFTSIAMVGFLFDRRMNNHTDKTQDDTSE